jgi:hypothetical protein
MNSQTHFQIGAVAASAVLVLSLTAATATTTDVIFSCEEDEGEYADTDLETDSAGNIYGTIRCFIALRVAPMEVSLTKE